MTQEEFKITCRAFFPDIEFRERSGDGGRTITTEAIYMPVMNGMWHEGRLRHKVAYTGKIEVAFGALILENAAALSSMLHSFNRTGALTGNGMINRIITEKKK